MHCVSAQVNGRCVALHMCTGSCTRQLVLHHTGCIVRCVLAHVNERCVALAGCVHRVLHPSCLRRPEGFVRWRREQVIAYVNPISLASRDAARDAPSARPARHPSARRCCFSSSRDESHSAEWKKKKTDAIIPFLPTIPPMKL